MNNQYSLAEKHEIGKAINAVDNFLTRVRIGEITLSNGEPLTESEVKTFSRAVALLKANLHKQGILQKGK